MGTRDDFLGAYDSCGAAARASIVDRVFPLSETARGARAARGGRAARQDRAVGRESEAHRARDVRDCRIGQVVVSVSARTALVSQIQCRGRQTFRVVAGEGLIEVVAEQLDLTFVEP